MRVGVVFNFLFLLPEVVQAEVGDLDHESTVHHTVSGLQVTMATNLCAVKIGHSLLTVERNFCVTC